MKLLFSTLLLGENDKFFLNEKQTQGKLCKKYKGQYDTKAEAFKKEVKWSNKTKNTQKITKTRVHCTCCA